MPLRTDEEILNLFWERNEEAIEATDARYGAQLYHLAYGILLNHQDCEECKNNTYLTAWQTIPPKRPKWLFAFLSKIMRNGALDIYRKNNAQKRGQLFDTISWDEAEGALPCSLSIEDEVLLRELGGSIEVWLSKLPETERDIFLARYYYFDSLEKIAADFHKNKSAVYRLLKEEKEELMKYLGSEGWHL